MTYDVGRVFELGSIVGGKFQIAAQDFASRQVQVLTAGPLDESPSVAPSGKLVLYANEVGGRGILAAVSSDGRIKQRLVAPATDVREQKAINRRVRLSAWLGGTSFD